MNARRKFVAAMLAGGVVAGALVPSGAEATATKSGRHSVTSERIDVFAQPNKSFQGYMFEGQTFDVEKLSKSGKYAYGMAYGHVNKHVWIYSSALKKKA